MARPGTLLRSWGDRAVEPGGDRASELVPPGRRFPEDALDLSDERGQLRHLGRGRRRWRGYKREQASVVGAVQRERRRVRLGGRERRVRNLHLQRSVDRLLRVRAGE